MSTARFATLQEWLSWQKDLHPRSVDLGLARLQHVMVRLGLELPPRYRVVTVAGTNGKGSCVAFLEAMLRAGGYRVGAYTSPHLLRYNERIRIDGVEVEDSDLCQAFSRIDAARGDISLTYFEFGTLAAFQVFQEATIDVAVLEVGLGGRLDAVNVLDADAALVTTVDIDHVEWLGPDRDSIAYEKAGIYRCGRPAIYADTAPPDSLLRHAQAIRAPLYLYGRDYGFVRTTEHWTWWSDNRRFEALPLPRMPGVHQCSNAAAALMAVAALVDKLPLRVEAIHEGLYQAYVPARFQIISGPVEWIFDVTHNPQGAAVLAHCLRERACRGRTHAVLGMFRDKNAVAVSRCLEDVVDEWYVTSLGGSRGRPGEMLVEALGVAGIDKAIHCFGSAKDACQVAAANAATGDRIVVFGSFYTVAAAFEVGLGRA